MKRNLLPPGWLLQPCEGLWCQSGLNQVGNRRNQPSKAFDELNCLKLRNFLQQSKQLICVATVLPSSPSCLAETTMLWGLLLHFFVLLSLCMFDEISAFPFVTPGAFVFGLLAHVWTRYSGFNPQMIWLLQALSYLFIARNIAHDQLCTWHHDQPYQLYGDEQCPDQTIITLALVAGTSNRLLYEIKSLWQSWLSYCKSR